MKFDPACMMARRHSSMSTSGTTFVWK